MQTTAQGSSQTVLDDLLAAIREAADDNTLHWSETPQPLSGGFWAEMWRVSLTTDGPLAGDLAARVMPDAGTAAGETEVQRHLSSVGFPTPAVRLARPPGANLDRAWMLMDFAPGQPMLSGLSGPSALIRLPKLIRALPDQLAGHAATLHQIDPTGIASSPDGVFGSRDVATTLEDLVTIAGEIDRPDLTRKGRRLLGAEPQRRSEPVICHGDLHPFNILSGPNGDTVLDWSAAQLADPIYDLSYTHLLLRNPPLDAPGPLRPMINRAGRSMAKRFITRYVQLSGHDVNDRAFDWFTAVHCLRILVEVGNWKAEGTVDQHPGHPFLAMGEIAVNRIDRVTD